VPKEVDSTPITPKPIGNDAQITLWTRLVRTFLWWIGRGKSGESSGIGIRRGCLTLVVLAFWRGMILMSLIMKWRIGCFAQLLGLGGLSTKVKIISERADLAWVGIQFSRLLITLECLIGETTVGSEKISTRWPSTMPTSSTLPSRRSTPTTCS